MISLVIRCGNSLIITEKGWCELNHILKSILLTVVITIGMTCRADMLFWLLDTVAYNIVKEENITKMTYIVCDDNGDVVATGRANNHVTTLMSDRQYEFNWSKKWNRPEYSFMIELVNSDDEKWISSVASYDDIISSGAIRNPGLFDTKYFGGFTDYHPLHVPEPDISVLYLIGTCLLLLKRKN